MVPRRFRFLSAGQAAMSLAAAVLLMAIPLQAQIASRSPFAFSDRRIKSDSVSFELRTFSTAGVRPEQSKLILQVGIANSQLQFIKHDKKTFKADVAVGVAIFDTAGASVQEDDWTETFFADNFDKTTSEHEFNATQEFYTLPPGIYDVRISLEDVETGRTGSLRRRVRVRDFSGDSLAVSDIIFLRSVDFLQEGSGKTAAPAAPHELYAYFEIYNVPVGDTVKFDYVLSDTHRKMPGAGTLISEGRQTAFYLTVNTDSLQQRDLGVALRVSDGQRTVSMRQSLNPSRAAPKVLENLDEAIEVLSYIAGKKELKKLKKLQDAEKLRAFEAFWLKRDPTPETPENEYKDIYYGRIEAANREFSDIQPGWKTELGMVFVKLGPPEYVDRSYQQNSFTPFSNRPLIVWHYSKYGRSVVFRYVGGHYEIANYSQIFDMISGNEIRL